MPDNKEYDYSKLFKLLDKERLKEIGKELTSQAITNTPIDYVDCYVNVQIPSTVVRLLETLTEILPIELEDILSKMASQGLNNILQEVTGFSEEKTATNLLDDSESLNKITDKLSDLQGVIDQFSTMSKIFGEFGNDVQLSTENKDKNNPK
tara:strand:- start:989 stop:1441 length:453 start_codon:yes stop_codon:yes gene_type:complete